MNLTNQSDPKKVSTVIIYSSLIVLIALIGVLLIKGISGIIYATDVSPEESEESEGEVTTDSSWQFPKLSDIFGTIAKSDAVWPDDFIDHDAIKLKAGTEDEYEYNVSRTPVTGVFNGVPVMKPHFDSSIYDENSPDILPSNLAEAEFLNTWMPLRDMDVPEVSPPLSVQYVEFTSPASKQHRTDKHMWESYDDRDLRKAANGFVVSEERDTMPGIENDPYNDPYAQHIKYLMAICFDDHTLMHTQVPTQLPTWLSDRGAEGSMFFSIFSNSVAFLADSEDNVCSGNTIKFTGDPYTGWAISSVPVGKFAEQFHKRYSYKTAVTCLSDRPFENIEVQLEQNLQDVERSAVAFSYGSYSYPLVESSHGNHSSYYSHPDCQK